MRLQALRARPRGRRLPPDVGEPAGAVAANLLDRSFEANAPNRKWIADFNLDGRRLALPGRLMMAIWRHGKPDMLRITPTRAAQYTSEPSSACWPITALSA